MVQLGDKVKDRVTGLTGIATARTEWLNGCVRVSFEFVLNGEGKSHTCDQEQLEVVRAGAVQAIRPAVVQKGARRTGGGGRPDAIRPAIPGR